MLVTSISRFKNQSKGRNLSLNVKDQELVLRSELENFLMFCSHVWEIQHQFQSRTSLLLVKIVYEVRVDAMLKYPRTIIAHMVNINKVNSYVYFHFAGKEAVQRHYIRQYWG